jgi:hypothetical protein
MVLRSGTETPTIHTTMTLPHEVWPLLATISATLLVMAVIVLRRTLLAWTRRCC